MKKKQQQKTKKQKKQQQKTKTKKIKIKKRNGFALPMYLAFRAIHFGTRFFEVVLISVRFGLAFFEAMLQLYFLLIILFEETRFF